MAQVAAITGAGAGVGCAVVTAFAGAGYDIVLLAREPERLERAAEETRRLGVRALPIPMDVADANAVEAAADRVETRSGRTGSPPAFADHFLAKHGYSAQTIDQSLPEDYKGNLWEPVKGAFGARGRFNGKARLGSWEMFTDRHCDAAYAGLGLLGGILVLHQLAEKSKF